MPIPSTTAGFSVSSGEGSLIGGHMSWGSNRGGLVCIGERSGREGERSGAVLGIVDGAKVVLT